MKVFGLGWIDLLVIAACGLTFAAAIVSHHRAQPPGPPTDREIQQLADELGVTADQLRRAAEIAPPPPRGERPSPEQRDKARTSFAAALNIPVGQLDTVMRRHRPPPRD